MAAPRKYLDRDRTEVNPEWLEWRREQVESRIAYLGPDMHERYFPEEYGKAIPDEGAWVMVLEEPHTELRSRFRIPLRSVWRARRHELNSGGFEGVAPKQAVIATPGGDLHLWPHEYSVMGDVTFLVGQEPDVEMRRLGGEPVFSGELVDQLFYLQARGISRQEAALLLINGAVDPRVYFVLAPELVEALGSLGVPLWRHVQMHPRTRVEVT